MNLAQVLVRQGASRKLLPFRDDRILQDVRKGVLKRLDEVETAEIVRSALHALEADLASGLQDLSEKEQRAWPGHLGVIDDFRITSFVEAKLKDSSSRMAHVLYSLYVRGRADVPNRAGWKSAEDVLEWLYLEYPSRRPQGGIPERPRRASDRWYPPSEAPHPTWVIKRQDRTPSRDRIPSPARADFRMTQFEEGIGKALSGRQKAGTKTYCTAQWVLWGLVGQTDVHSMQLAVGVLDCLRRVDDIAYLRWACIAKGIDSVGRFSDEALGLVRHPSPELLFDVTVGPRPRRGPEGRVKEDRSQQQQAPDESAGGALGDGQENTPGGQDAVRTTGGVRS